MKTIAAAKFKAQCLALLDRLGPDGLIVTKHGRPVAIVRPIGHSSKALIGSLKGRIKIAGDVMTTRVKWDAGR